MLADTGMLVSIDIILLGIHWQMDEDHSLIRRKSTQRANELLGQIYQICIFRAYRSSQALARLKKSMETSLRKTALNPKKNT